MVFTNTGVQKLINYLAGDAPVEYPKYMGVGTGATAPAVTQTALVKEAYRAEIDTTSSTTDSVTYRYVLPSTVMNGLNLREFGTFYGDESVIDDCETADWTDSADMTTSLNSTTFIEGSNAINLTKDDTNSADAETHKTTTEVTMGVLAINMFLYVKEDALDNLATTSCLTIRFGSADDAYYEWVFDKADLTHNAWNNIGNLTAANADSTTGTPTDPMDYSLIQLTADAAGTTWSAGDFIMDEWKLAGATMFTRSTHTVVQKSNVLEVEYSVRVEISNG